MTHDFLYGFSDAAYLMLAVIPIFWLLWRLYQYRQGTFDAFARSSVLDQVVKPRSVGVFWGKVIAICLIWLLAVVALMQPTSYGQYPDEYLYQEKKDQEVILRRKAHDVVLLIDVSTSMEVDDARGGKPRLEEAKEIADAIVSSLNGENVAVYAFTSALTQLSPPTLDYLFARNVIGYLGLNEGGIGGTDFTAVLKELFQEYSSSIRLKTVIFLSDGGDTKLEMLSGRARKQQIKRIVDLVADAKTQNLRVMTVGMGSLKGGPVPGVMSNGSLVLSKLDEDLLKRISHKGRGRYYSANDLAPLAIAEDISAVIQQEEPYVDERTIFRESLASASKELLIYDLYYQIPLGIAILLLVFVLFFPDIKKLLSLLLIFGFFSFAEAGFEEQMRLSHAFFEAKEYEKAQELDHELLEGKLSRWQHTVVLYHLGAIRYAEKDWEGAIAQWSAIPLGERPPHVLARKLNAALALAHLHQDGEYHLKQALSALKSADDADCLLAKSKGSSECAPAQDLEEIRLAVKQKLARTLEIKKDLGIDEGISLLFSGIYTLRQHLEFLQNSALSQVKRGKYQTLYLDEAEKWKKIWNDLDERVYGDDFLAASKHFRQSLTFLKKGHFDKSLQAVNLSEQSLRTVIRRLWGETGSFNLLQSLLSIYQKALAQDPLQEITLQTLLNKQKEMLQYINGLQSTMKEISEGLNFLKKGEQDRARAWVLVAQQSVKRLLRNHEGKTAEAILDHTIDDQSHVLMVSRLIGTNDPLAFKAQKDALLTAGPFLATVLKQQMRDYPFRCQKHPWDEVLLLYDRGYQSAENSLKRTKLEKREIALKAWQEALRKMQQPLKKPPEVEKETEEVLRLLQEMELEDHIPKAPKSLPTRGERPW